LFLGTKGKPKKTKEARERKRRAPSLGRRRCLLFY